MQPRQLGRTDLVITPVVFGTMARRQADDASREQLIRAAVDRGLTALDTAPLYNFGRCEAQIGRALRGVPRDRVQLLTRVGLRWHGESHGRVLFTFDDAQGRRVEVRKDARPESVRWEVEQSLQRLQVECLDLVRRIIPMSIHRLPRPWANCWRSRRKASCGISVCPTSAPSRCWGPRLHWAMSHCVHCNLITACCDARSRPNCCRYAARAGWQGTLCVASASTRAKVSSGHTGFASDTLTPRLI